MTADDIRIAFTTARHKKRGRHRDIAEQLEISEGELIDAHVGAGAERTLTALRLAPQWPQIIAALEPVGDVMALTRNASCVHEKVGTYRNCSVGGTMGLVLGGEIDLRVFYGRWAHGYAVAEGTQRSLQFFDAVGTAIHKVFLRDGSDATAFDALVAAHTAADQSTGTDVTAPAPRAAAAPDDTIDVAALRQGWASMRDTHEFFGLLKRHGVTRTQALRLADPHYARPVAVDAATCALTAAAANGTPIMVFVGNPGMIQIHSGPVRKVALAGPWLNVLDPGFNLHLRQDHVAAAWVVGKPTSDGLVTSIELFDSDGETIAMLFGERKPGKPELASWRSLVEAVVHETTPCDG